MGRAGYCASCGRNVWLDLDGGCENGHPASAISNMYEAASPPVLPAAPVPQPPSFSRRARRLLIAGVVLLLCLVIGLCVIVASLARPLASQTASAAGEWSGRLSKDYPGWKQVSFNVGTFSGTSGQKRTTWSFGLVPPDRDFSVGVQYVSENGGAPVLQDETLRSAGTFHARADSLLDYIETTHIKRGRSVTAITGGDDGAVTVNWIKVTQVGPFSSRVGSFEELVYDEATGSWRVFRTAPE